MNTVITLTKKELRDAFASPLAYVFLTVFLGLSFWLYFSEIFVINEASVRAFFKPLLFIVFLPSLTMGKWADEHKNGTFELLMTLPAKGWQLNMAKFLAVGFLLVILLLLTLPLPITLAFLGEIDSGQVIGSYLGIFLLGLNYLAVGIFISSLTKNPIIAFLITVVGLFVLFILAEPLVTTYLPQGLVPVLQFLSFHNHFESLSRGVVGTRDIFYFSSTTLLFLYLTNLILKTQR